MTPATCSLCAGRHATPDCPLAALIVATANVQPSPHYERLNVLRGALIDAQRTYTLIGGNRHRHRAG